MLKSWENLAELTAKIENRLMGLKNKNIGIVGGTGKFGQHLGKKLHDSNKILISGSTKEKAKIVAQSYDWSYGSNKQVASRSDVLIVAVPIAYTEEVIHEVGPEVDDQCLFCDITSVKESPVEAMSKYSDEVLGMHPMYAPSNTIEGQKVVLTPEKGGKWKMMKEFWDENGAETFLTDPETHDKAMSIVQGLMHFSELVVADVIRKSDLTNDEMSNFSSPVYELITSLSARMLNQKPGLYRSIQVENLENEKIRQNFVESAKEIEELIEDEDKFAERFEELGEEFNLDQAQEKTDKVIEFLSEM